ncbi:hypothetical protein L7F22_008348 [Adiantum nelumboides]|nr:hypothetical protein [Adiantum nelumboides]
MQPWESWLSTHHAWLAAKLGLATFAALLWRAPGSPFAALSCPWPYGYCRQINACEGLWRCCCKAALPPSAAPSLAGAALRPFFLPLMALQELPLIGLVAMQRRPLESTSTTNQGFSTLDVVPPPGDFLKHEPLAHACGHIQTGVAPLWRFSCSLDSASQSGLPMATSFATSGDAVYAKEALIIVAVSGSLKLVFSSVLVLLTDFCKLVSSVIRGETAVQVWLVSVQFSRSGSVFCNWSPIQFSKSGSLVRDSSFGLNFCNWLWFWTVQQIWFTGQRQQFWFRNHWSETTVLVQIYVTGSGSGLGKGYVHRNAQEWGSTIPLVNDQAFDKSIKNSSFVHMIFVKDSSYGVNKTQVNESGMYEDLDLSNFLNQFQDVFIDDIPGELPPKQGDDDQMIELLPGSSPPNKPPYRVSQAQQEEIMRQVKKLVEKGIVRPSSSPFCSPVLLV